VVAFSVFRTLTGIARQIVAQLSHAVGGELGRRHFCQDFQGTAVLMSHAGRLVSGSSGLLCGAVLAFSKPFLDVWTQGKVGYDPWLCAIFLLSILVTAPAQVAYMVYLYTNRPNILVLVGGLQVLATVALCAVLVGPYSVIGAALACTAADCLTVGLLLPLMAARSLDLRVLRYLRDCLAVASLCLGLSALVAFGLVRVLPVQGYFGIAAGGVLWAALLAGPAFRLLLTLPQRQWVFEQLHRIVVGLCSLQRKRN
jgi:O-antigen/teichoic acid export membrane protein